jgi:hypothetical protein
MAAETAPLLDSDRTGSDQRTAPRSSARNPRSICSLRVRRAPCLMCRTTSGPDSPQAVGWIASKQLGETRARQMSAAMRKSPLVAM